MSKRLLPTRWQRLGPDGRPLAGARLYTYVTGTSTPKSTFTDAGLTVAAANPLVADANGTFPQVFLAAGDYKMELRDASETVIATDDPVDGNDAAAGDGTALLPSITFASDPNTGVWRPGADTWAVSTNGVERIRLTSSGSMGVAVTAPLATLHVNGNALFGGAVTGQTGIIAFSSGATAAGVEAVDPTNTLIKRAMQLQHFGGELFSLAVWNNTDAGAANVVVNAAGKLMRSTSSRRYKANIAEIDPDVSLERVMSWRPVTYSPLNDPNTRYAGFIAEEIAEAGSVEYVTRDGEGRPDALHYGHMVADLAGAIQALAARVAELEDAVDG